MPFPFLSPVKKWVVDVLKDRENPINDTSTHFNSILKTPWVILTSGAKVVQISGLKELSAEKRIAKLRELYSTKSSNQDAYLGCIIQNNLNIDSKYQTDESYIGFDFSGKKVKVEGERNRRISTPIIENVEIDTDGANNTLKTARVTVRCFSLKQFELFELFFCKPGMNVLVEFGDNTLETYRFKEKKPANAYSNVTELSTQLFTKTDYNNFVDIFSNYYRFTNTSFKRFQQHVEKSLGSYDFVAGKVTEFNFGIESDGTYTISLDISQGNQMSLAIPTNISNDKAQTDTPGKSKNGEQFDQWIAQLCADLNIEKDKLSASKADWGNEFFNWGKVSDTKQDETASTERYISLRFILKKLMNYSLFQTGYEPNTFDFKIPTYNIGGSQKEYIPIRSHKNIISSNTDIIYPNKQMITFVAPTNGDKADIINISNKTIDCSINGYSVNDGVIVQDDEGSIINPTTTDGCCGNALNIFLNYKLLVQIWKATYSRIDFITAILDAINSNSLGKFRLIVGNVKEGTSATIMDYTSQSKNPIPVDNLIYRFNPNTIQSNVIDFSFNFEMSNLVAGRTVFNSQRFLTNALKNITDTDKALSDIPLPDNIFQEFDMSMMSNADGRFSLNMIELSAIEKNFKDTVNKPTTFDNSEGEAPQNEAINYTDIIDGKSIKFKFKDGIKTLIFTDTELIRKAISEPEEDKKSILSPITVTLVIDGINGFNCGEYFRINGVPEIYNQIGVFQITNIKHSVSAEGWRTTLEAQFRITPKK
jgi:hypothetical protein